MNKDKKIVIFDLDGTLADISARRALSIIDGKMDWDRFFNPENIKLDEPNIPVIKAARVFAQTGHRVIILSGRSKATKDITRKWLADNNVPFDILKMRPTNHPWKFMPDDKLKQHWLDTLLNKDDIICVFDDRQKVVNMWRENGVACFQDAPGDF